MLNTYTSNKCPYQVITSYIFYLLRYIPYKILKVKVTTAKSNVKSRSHYGIANLCPPTNVPSKNRNPTPYGLLDTASTSFIHLDAMGKNNTNTVIKFILFIYLGFYVAFNTVQVISRRVVGRAEETSTYSSLGFCTVNYRQWQATTSFPT